MVVRNSNSPLHVLIRADWPRVNKTVGYCASFTNFIPARPSASFFVAGLATARDGIKNCAEIPMLATQTQTRFSASSMFYK
jgi:hypothetical protein